MHHKPAAECILTLICILMHVPSVTQASNGPYISTVYVFFSGKTLNRASVLTTLREAKMLVSAFEGRSSCVPSAISALDRIFNKLQPQVSFEPIF